MRDWPARTRTWLSGGRLRGINTTASRGRLRTAWCLKSNASIHQRGCRAWFRPKDAMRRLDELRGRPVLLRAAARSWDERLKLADAEVARRRLASRESVDSPAETRSPIAKSRSPISI